MFSKYATLLAFAASAIAGVIEPGRYRITNVASGSTARSYLAYSPVFVTSTYENPGPFDLWDVRDSENGSYTLKNVGLGTFAYASPGEVVETGRKATAFDIESEGNDEYVIKLPYEDFLWGLELRVLPYEDVNLRLADGRSTERWFLTPYHQKSAQDDYDERWGLLQRIGRFLGRLAF